MHLVRFISISGIIPRCNSRNVVGSGKVGKIINGLTTSTGQEGTGDCDLSIGTYFTTSSEISDWQLSSLYVRDSHLSHDVLPGCPTS